MFHTMHDKFLVKRHKFLLLNSDHLFEERKNDFQVVLLQSYDVWKVITVKAMACYVHNCEYSVNCLLVRAQGSKLSASLQPAQL